MRLANICCNLSMSKCIRSVWILLANVVNIKIFAIDNSVAQLKNCGSWLVITIHKIYTSLQIPGNTFFGGQRKFHLIKLIVISFTERAIENHTFFLSRRIFWGDTHTSLSADAPYPTPTRCCRHRTCFGITI